IASLVATIAVVATLQQLCTYIAVRYTVYLTAEFDEPLDGIVYISAGALGLATALNVEFVVRNEGVLPVAGAATIALSSLVHVAAAAVLGYGLGRARFAAQGGPWWLAASFGLSILVNGGMKHAAWVAGVDGPNFRPWVTLAVAVLLTL